MVQVSDFMCVCVEGGRGVCLGCGSMGVYNLFVGFGILFEAFLFSACFTSLCELLVVIENVCYFTS